MSQLEIEKLKSKAKLLQKAKRRAGILIPLKEAFHRIALAAGFSSWRDLRATVDATGIFCPKGGSAFWKLWFASYAEARACAEEKKGFLLPYRKQFFVCDEAYIEFLGVPATDDDLALVGRNWAEPSDQAAWRRILRRIEKAHPAG